MSLSSVVGNLFIYATIALLGPVSLSLITTTRKVFSIFVSILINGHSTDLYKIIGIGLVILGIILEMLQGIGPSDDKKKSK
jgi:drug/metabolite transporter (DMT)-like permease